MKLSCPHCSQNLELDPETLLALEGSSHFDCPICGGAVEVPTPVLVPTKQTPPTHKGKPTPETVARQTQQGSNQNMLVLGVMALLAIGGAAIFLASKNGGNVFNIFQNTTKQIINNSYFTQLIADGVTTKDDLESIAEIRPYGEGFIGIGKEKMSWEEARVLSQRTGSTVLSIAGPESDRIDLVSWLLENFTDNMKSSVWVRDGQQAQLLDGGDILAASQAKRLRNVLLHWRGGNSAAERLVDVLALAGFESSPREGIWKMMELGLEVEKRDGGSSLETPYEPASPEYDLSLVFSLTASRTGDLHLRLPTESGTFSLALQSYPYRGFQGHHVGGYDGKHVGRDTATLLQLGLAKESTMQFTPGQKHELTVKLRESALEVVLDKEVLISWQGDISRFKFSPERMKYGPSNLVIGATHGGVIFHQITSSEKLSRTP